MHLGVQIAVGHEDVAGVRIECDMSALVEWRPAHRLGRLAANTDGHQHLPVEGAFSHRVVEDIGEPHGVIRTYGNAMGARKHKLVAPAMKEFAAAIEHDDGSLAAIEQVDVAFG